jgi:hypothetical protein
LVERFEVAGQNGCQVNDYSADIAYYCCEHTEVDIPEEGDSGQTVTTGGGDLSANVA